MTALASSNVDYSFRTLRIRRLAGRIGGEVLDLQLAAGLSQEVLADLQAALARHKVLFFRRQSTLDDAGQEAFAQRLGDAASHPVAARGGWQTDASFLAAFPRFSIQRAVKVPEYGGDTVWANTVAAFESLAPDLQALAQRLWAVHGHGVFEAEHPLVHVHPVTGERALLLGGFVKEIAGFSAHESARLLELLQHRATQLEHTVRWAWRQDDVALWDNHATQHYTIDDFGAQVRVMRQFTVGGEPALSVDGLRSRTRGRPDAMNDAWVRGTVAWSA